MQFRSTVNSDFNIFDLVSTSAPGLKGSFVYTGYVSSTNGVSCDFEIIRNAERY